MGGEVKKEKEPSPPGAGWELQQDAAADPLANETTAIHVVIRILEGLGPIQAKRVVDFVVTHQQERLANLMQQQRQRQQLNNETVAG